ncbi:conserved hypothetical protein [Theileria equi strain WA]|uniref:F-box domain-containing protein n=1 Tax=Theileria equi strain WA TaxID=1537102 RepID=L1LB13_THEEQ|nr:conserved hypothetical protein [Theileria equi strain WA]EKX72459.1 conserved hypothetical protein [Theileria equi strain WA]|eukprot:XP_004831911.1 conserved hypothetical protein [Theileria equi strain WA]
MDSHLPCNEIVCPANPRDVIYIPSVISSILKFIPFYERLLLRLVCKNWNKSFQFSQCWESIDFRFHNLLEHPLYGQCIRRFITDTKRVDICIDQLKSVCAFATHQGVYKKTGQFPWESRELSEAETDVSASYERDVCDDMSIEEVISVESDVYMEECECISIEEDGIYTEKGDTGVEEHLVNMLNSLKNLEFLQISEKCGQYKTICTRVSPLILDHVSTHKNSNEVIISHVDLDVSMEDLNTPKDLANGLQTTPQSAINSPQKSLADRTVLQTLIIDSPIDISSLLKLVPFVKNVKNLVISRIIDCSVRFTNVCPTEESYYSVHSYNICSAVAELVEHVPESQLVSLQIGRTLNSHPEENIQIANDAKLRNIRRVKEAEKIFGEGVDEADEVLLVLLERQANIKYLIMEDVDLSYGAYKKMNLLK